VADRETPAAGPPKLVGVRDPKPPWLKVKAPGGERYATLKQTFRKLDLNTVCEEARCPNVGECWGAGTATVMLLGHTCTRGCRFCAVTTGNPRGAVDPREPEHTARALGGMGLSYVVLTMVDRDDLLDGGATHVAETVRALHRHQPDLLVETLVGDFGGRKADLNIIVDAAPDVFAHNVEAVRRLTPLVRDQRCSYELSMDVLRHAKRRAPERFVKSSVMVGIGERDEEVFETLRDLRDAGVDVVTIGQYLRPSPKHATVARYVEPAQFDAWATMGNELGFAYVASGPLVRSSYHAAEAFVQAKLRPGPALDTAAPPALAAESNRLAHAPSPDLVPAARLARGPVANPERGR